MTMQPITLYCHPKWPGNYIVVRAGQHDRFKVPIQAGGWQKKTVWYPWSVQGLPEAAVDPEAEAQRLGIPLDGLQPQEMDPAIRQILGGPPDAA